MLIRWCLLGSDTVQDCGWSVMFQRNMPPSSGVTGFCPGICRKKGRITALQETYSLVHLRQHCLTCAIVNGAYCFSLSIAIFQIQEKDHIYVMALYTYSHLWLCGTMTRAIKYLSFFTFTLLHSFWPRQRSGHSLSMFLSAQVPCNLHIKSAHSLFQITGICPGIILSPKVG